MHMRTHAPTRSTHKHNNDDDTKNTILLTRGSITAIT